MKSLLGIVLPLVLLAATATLIVRTRFAQTHRSAIRVAGLCTCGFAAIYVAVR